MDIQSVWPKRAMSVTPARTNHPLVMASLFGIGALACGWLVSEHWPDLQRDFQIGENVEPAAGVTVGGRCKTKVVFTWCDLELTRRNPSAGQPALTQHSYMFADIGFGGYQVGALQARGAPSKLTTTLGLEHLWNRAIMLGFWGLLTALLVGAIPFVVSKSVKARRAFAALDGQLLTPVEVMISSRHKKNWFYREPNQGRRAQQTISLPKDEIPFIIAPDGKSALAVKGPGGGPSMLLDGKLSSLGLSDTERAQLWAWQAARLGVSQPT